MTASTAPPTGALRNNRGAERAPGKWRPREPCCKAPMKMPLNEGCCTQTPFFLQPLFFHCSRPHSSSDPQQQPVSVSCLCAHRESQQGREAQPFAQLPGRGSTSQNRGQTRRARTSAARKHVPVTAAARKGCRAPLPLHPEMHLRVAAVQEQPRLLLLLQPFVFLGTRTAVLAQHERSHQLAWGAAPRPAQHFKERLAFYPSLSQNTEIFSPAAFGISNQFSHCRLLQV